MNRVTHFEIQADDIDRATKFYSEIFDWKIQKWEGMEYWMIMTAPMDSTERGINGGMVKRPTGMKELRKGTNAYVCTVEVSDFDATADKILKAGGMEAMAKFDIGGMAWQGYFIDTEGNTFGLHQRK